MTAAQYPNEYRPGGGRVCRKLSYKDVCFLAEEFMNVKKSFSHPIIIQETINRCFRQVRDMGTGDISARVLVWMTIRELDDLKILQKEILREITFFKVNWQTPVLEETIRRYQNLTEIFLQLN